MATNENTRGRSRAVIGVLGGVVVVILVLGILVATGVTSPWFAKDVNRTVRNDVDSSALVAQLVAYPDTFRGAYLADGQVRLAVTVEPGAVPDIGVPPEPGVIVLRSFSCPGADGTAAITRLIVSGADAGHLQTAPTGTTLSGLFAITDTATSRPAPGVVECRVNLEAR